MNKPYSVSVRITEPKGNILWVRRSPSAPKRAGQYEYPGGHVEPGERAREAALREVREEVGLKIPEYELRVLKRVPQTKGDHIIFEYRAKKAFKPRLSIEHDHFIWSPQKPTLSNGIFSYFKGKDTSGMTTEEKARQAAVGAGTTVAIKGASKAISKKLAARTAAKVGTKVAAKGASKFVPLVGQAIMVIDAAPEAIAVARESREHNKRTWREVKAAEGVTGKVKALGKGTARATAHRLGGVARIGAAAFVGSDVVKMGREAAMEKYQAMDNGLGSRLGGRLGGRLVGKAVQQGAKKAAQEGGKKAAKRVFKAGVGKAVAAPESLKAARRFAALAPQYTKAVGSLLGEAGKIVGLTTAAVGTAAFAVKGAVGAVKGRQQPPPPPAATNPSEIRANVAEINKLLKTMPSAWQTQLASSRMKLQAAGADASQIPPERPNAHNVLFALNLNNRGEVSSEAAAGQEPTEGNPVPEDVREAAMEGIRLSHENNYGGYDFIGVARAIQLAISPRISNAALNRMRMYFDRKTKQDRMSDQYAQQHGKRYWSWLNWGGDPGARWSGSKRFAELIKENPMSARHRHNPGESLTALQVQQRYTNDYFEGIVQKKLSMTAAIQYAAEKNGVTIISAPSTPSTPRAASPQGARPAARGVNVEQVKGGIRERREGGGCPVCGQQMDRYNNVRVPKGRWVHRECADAERMTVEFNEHGAQESARTGKWFMLPLTDSAKALLSTPPLAEIEKVPKGTFTQRDIVRLLARPDKKGFSVVKRMFEKMLSRQTEGEKHVGRSHVLNLSGFNQPDAKKAKEILEELETEGYSPFLHFRMSSMLLNYVNTQLPQIMNGERKEGADFSLRTNPVPGITMEEWFADVQDSDWANWDLDRAGIMHYSGRGVPTYQSIVRK